MGNSRRRMRSVNHILRKELKRKGFYDITLFPHTRWFKDLWGLWDGVCKLQDSEPSTFEVYYLQLKTGYASKELKEAMGKFCKQSNQKGILVEYAPVMKKLKKREGYYMKARNIIITYCDTIV
jgi:hypothetical protein